MADSRVTRPRLRPSGAPSHMHLVLRVGGLLGFNNRKENATGAAGRRESIVPHQENLPKTAQTPTAQGCRLERQLPAPFQADGAECCLSSPCTPIHGGRAWGTPELRGPLGSGLLCQMGNLELSVNVTDTTFIQSSQSRGMRKTKTRNFISDFRYQEPCFHRVDIYNKMFYVEGVWIRALSLSLACALRRDLPSMAV